jgi:hypothetical protein
VHDRAEKNPRWGKEHAWKGGRPIPRSTVHWLRLYPLPGGTPAGKATQTIQAESAGDNRFVLVSESARKVRLYLHPKMVDFARPVEVEVNGKVAFKGKVTPSLRTMLELVREFDDAGRVFHAALDVDIATDQEVPEPTAKK